MSQLDFRTFAREMSLHRAGAKRVAYIMSRFPKISETFILNEMIEIEKLGVEIAVFPILRQNEDTMHSAAAPFVARAHYCKLQSWEVVGSQWYWLRRAPQTYFKAWRRGVAGNLKSIGFLLRALMIVPIAAHFARRMEELSVEHVHATWATHPALAAYVIQILAEIPYSFTAHSHEIYIDRTMLDEKIRGARFFTTISEYNRRMLASLYGYKAAQKMRVIHCGVDMERFAPGSAAKKSERFTIVCVASLQRHKGQRFLIEACAELKRRGIDFRCVLVGGGEDRPMLSELVRRLGVADRVELVGRQPSERVLEYLRSADVLTLQSVMMPNGMSEGVPVSLMEAMAVGCPVIASDLRGIPELVEHERTGLLVPPGNASELAGALIRIHDDQELGRKMARAAREKVEKEFQLQTNVAKLAALFTGEEVMMQERAA